MTCGIYMIQNLVNGKMYIGQSVDIESRWGRHKRELRGNDHDNKHLQRAWEKYGQENFEFTVICECDESQLNTKEIEYISKLRTYDHDFGYNKTYGGEGGRPTEETRRKQSEAHKGENNHFYGKHHSEEAKEKMSAAKKSKYCGENHPMYGKHLSEETKEKLSEALKGKYCGKNHPMFGKHHSEEAKEEISESRKGKCCGKNNPNYGKLGAKNHRSIPVVQLTLEGELVNVYGSTYEADREGGFDPTNINKCCKGRLKTHGGYRWCYLKDWLKEHNKGIPKKLYFID